MDINQLRQQYYQNAVRGYAQILAECQKHANFGRRPPPELLYAKNQFEMNARELMPPAMLAQADRESAALARQISERDYNQTQNMHAQQFAETLENQTRAMTKGRFGEKDGLTPQQWRDVRDGKKLKLPNRKQKFNKADIAKLVGAKTTKELDEKIEQLDQLVFVKKNRGDSAYQQRLREEKVSGELVDFWDRNNCSLVLSWQERMAKDDKDAPDFIEVEPSDDNRRRIQVEDAWAATENSIPSHRTDRIPESYLNHVEYNRDGDAIPSRTSDIANAWLQCEAGDGVEARYARDHEG